MKQLDEQRRLLLTVVQDQADQASHSSSSAPKAAAPQTAAIPQGTLATEDHAVTQSLPAASKLDRSHFILQHSISDATALSGSLRERFANSMPAQHARQPQPSFLQGESNHAAASLQASAAAGPLEKSQVCEAESGTVSTSSNRLADSGRVGMLSSAQKQNRLLHHSSMPVASTIGWHLRDMRPAGTMTRHRDSMYAEQQAYWQKKEALCPTIKNCIQEVQQLRAQLSVDSVSLVSDKTG